ncbi:hypothetical protein A4X03_0g9966, partial [Tilletia caries]
MPSEAPKNGGDRPELRAISAANTERRRSSGKVARRRRGDVTAEKISAEISVDTLLGTGSEGRALQVFRSSSQAPDRRHAPVQRAPRTAEPALSSANLLEGRTLTSSPTSIGDLSSGHSLDPQASSALPVTPPSADISCSSGSRPAQLSLSPFRPSEASSPSAPPPSPTRPDGVKTEPEPTSDSAWIAPATWRPPGRYVRVRHAP